MEYLFLLMRCELWRLHSDCVTLLHVALMRACGLTRKKSMHVACSHLMHVI